MSRPLLGELAPTTSGVHEIFGRFMASLTHKRALLTNISGSRVSIISKKNIRYEGVVCAINDTDATVALQNVKSWGTEGRELLDTTGASTFVPPKDVVYPYLLFHGQDVKYPHIHDEQAGAAAEARADDTVSDFMSRINADDAIKRLEEQVDELAEDPIRLPHRDEFTRLRTSVELLKKTGVTPAVEKRKRQALIKMQSLYGGVPNNMGETAQKWDKDALICAQESEQLKEECDRICEQMEVEQSDDGVNDDSTVVQVVLSTLLAEQRCDESISLHESEWRSSLEIDAILWGHNEWLKSLDRFIDTTRRAQRTFSEVRRKAISKRRYKVQKPLILRGEKVYAFSGSDAEKGDRQSWRMATILSHREIGSGHGYGPSRMYTVHFHHKQKPEEVNDYDVYAGGIHEYKLHSAFRGLQDEVAERVGRGEGKGRARCVDKVGPLIDESSKDPWAKQFGWVVTLGDEAAHFAFLTDALAAHDAHVIQSEGLEEGLEDGMIADGHWHHQLVRASDKKTASNKANARCRLRLRTILMKEVMPDCDMKRIGDALTEMSGPTHSLMRPDGVDDDALHRQTCYIWKGALNAFLYDDEQLMMRHVLCHGLLMECVTHRTQIDELLKRYIDAAGDIDTFSSNMLEFQWAHDSCSSLEEMMEYLDGVNVLANNYIFVNVRHPNGVTKERFIVLDSDPIDGSIKNYATENNTTMKSLRLKHNGGTIFLSSIRDKSPRELGMTDYQLEVTYIQQTSPDGEQASKPKPKSQPNSKKGKRKKHKKSNKKRSSQPASFENEEEKLRSMHSQAITNVFEEADATFRKIRQRLDAMNLERQLPKEKRSQPKAKTPPVEPLDNPPSDGLAGKAGKSHFIVQVGEVANLYKTSKPSAARSSTLERSESIMIDLHGLSVEEALIKLDESLVEWVEIAMRGSYPWVIPVKIVCGGGGQVLSEAVENWIKRNDKVSNAPKNLFS